MNPRRRLAVWLSFAFLFQFFALALVLGLLIRANTEDPPLQSLLRQSTTLAATALTPVWDDAAARDQTARSLLSPGPFARVRLTSASGQTVFQGGTEPGGLFSFTERAELVRAGQPLGRLEVTWEPPPPALAPPLLALFVALLTVVGLGAAVARWLVRPIERLARAAHALGSGDLRARSGVERGDELGALAQAFDSMAHRISALVLSQTELLANVSHELRTPLSRIRVALDLAAEGEPFDASAVGELSTDVAELEALIGTVLSTARLSLSEGRVVDGFGPDRRPVSVGQLMERTTERFRRSHPGRALQVDVSASSELAVDLDATLFPRALDNLLDNAAQYSDGAVTVRVLQLEPGRLRLEVVDEGIGMSADDLAKAFQPFFRADKSRTRATGGLGLGLALCRRIVEAHGGVVQLTSEPGRGTVATIELPLVAQSLHIPTHG